MVSILEQRAYVAGESMPSIQQLQLEPPVLPPVRHAAHGRQNSGPKQEIKFSVHQSAIRKSSASSRPPWGASGVSNSTDPTKLVMLMDSAGGSARPSA